MYENQNQVKEHLPGTELETPRISRLVNNIHKAILTNQEIATNLQQRLHAVMLPSVPTADKMPNAAEARSAFSPLADDLETFETQLYALSAQYTDILNRLEV